MRPAIALRPAGLVLALLLTACAEGGGTGTTPAPVPEAVALPEAEDALVLQVEQTGGFVTPEMLAGRLPIVSVYGDGRVVTQGPVIAIYPAPAWPNVQVQQADRSTVQELAERALAAGVDETADLGSPPLADAPSTRFTLVTEDGPITREVYALQEGVGAGGLTAEQEAARAELRELLDELTDLSTTLGRDDAPTSYQPAAVAALARPWSAPADGTAQPELAWPGPALPGEPIAPGVTCVTASGEQARALADAAQDATTLTPWVGADGARWSITFRPLLPEESGCADLTG
ncbi:hypothetical protein [Modestobacter italicus]|uniref:hypothetical protein n=1 Tax=Modestobacter italicus (strain DSM 44449 / CECT 9708 / BC 501) TaxID=2732864 RepID=UPI001C96E026|nr:hypothetical protein [Modestobacter italicus]